MSFNEKFTDWLFDGLNQEIPDSVQALSFNLFEPAGMDGAKFGVELIGAARFDVDDSDWACEEIWQPTERQLIIPLSFSGATWEQCLDNVRALLLTLLQSDRATEKLVSMLGVGLGFVDGDLEIVWQAK